MAPKFAMLDTQWGDGKAVCGKFSTIERAMRELSHAVGVDGRFVIINRETKEVLARSKGNV